METRLFSWKDWNHLDDITFGFMDCTLNQNIGPLRKGAHIDSISINYETGELVAYDYEGKELAKVQLALLIVED